MNAKSSIEDKPLRVYQTFINECSTIVTSHVNKNSVQQLVNVKDTVESICCLADGIFKACSHIFEQMYVIYGSIKRRTNEIFVPLVFALMIGATNKSINLLKYFEHSNIMSRQAMKTRGRSRDLREPVYTPPIFPPELWSVDKRLLSGLPRTTNTAELWHRKLY
ncbi:Hypothetical protein CINCED_3A009048 [Cinara cedri]|uniref:Uncharacterized protein n=1 Tax=Cinara cedri TaxID=506608 RepID=A0A5E4MM48_9HEMI|nr:Hypothetical protein CINCED_3A009048 [Cinara cedri]